MRTPGGTPRYRPWMGHLLSIERRTALRRCVLAVAVLQDLDLVPGDDGVQVTSGRVVPWSALSAGLGHVDPESPAARPVLTAWLRTLHQLAWRSPDDLASRARPVGLPVGHALHPGPTWVRASVLGGALDLGVGLLGVGGDPDAVLVPPAGVLEAVGHDPITWWPACERYLAEMGHLAAERHLRHPDQPLRPMGDCDVATLLGSMPFRAALASGGQGLRAAAVPTRSRGWLDLSRTDPAFALVAAALAEDDERGFVRPLLVTADEVTMAREGGDPVLQALRDSVSPDPVLPAVRYR